MYIFGKNYDHLKYLEDRTHSDRIVTAIDQSVRTQVASESTLESLGATIMSQTEVISRGVSELGKTLSEGFEEIAWQLESIDSNLVAVGKILGHGFHAIDNRLLNIEITLKELLTTAKTPEQVWAAEQFSASQKYLWHGLFDEALEYINLAIDGNDRRLGYKLSPDFYMHRGRIREGSDLNYDSNVINLQLALADYKRAAQVSVRSSNEAKALVAVGRVFVKIDDPENALISFRESIQLDPLSDDAWYGAAKTLFYLGKVDEAAENLRQSLMINPYQGIAAGMDWDLLEHSDEVVRVLTEMRAEKAKKLHEIFQKYDSDLTALRQSARKFHEEIGSEINADLEKLGVIVTEINSLAYLDLQKVEMNYVTVVFSLIEGIDRSAENCKEKIALVKKLLEEEEANEFQLPTFLHFLIPFTINISAVLFASQANSGIGWLLAMLVAGGTYLLPMQYVEYTRSRRAEKNDRALAPLRTELNNLTSRRDSISSIQATTMSSW